MVVLRGQGFMLKSMLMVSLSQAPSLACPFSPHLLPQCPYLGPCEEGLSARINLRFGPVG